MKASTVRSFVILFVLAFVTLACSLSGAAPEPTAEPSPTELPPTDTSVPTDTPIPPTETPIPTPTPDIAATLSAEATKEAEAQIEIIKADLATIDMTVDTGSLGWFQVYPEVIDLSTHGDAYYSEFAEDLVVSDFIIKSDITWQSDGLVYCGLIFRSERDIAYGAQYILLYMRFSGLPAWDIEFYDNAEYKSNITQKVRFSDALNMENGAKNTFIIVVQGNEFTVYINGKRQGRFYDDSNLASEGRFAFLGAQQGGASTCSFEDTWVWVLK